MPPGETTFEGEGRTWTVLEWFRETQSVDLQHPQLPCLLFGKDGRNAVPMELCFLVPGNKAGVLTAEERSEKKADVRGAGDAQEELRQAAG